MDDVYNEEEFPLDVSEEEPEIHADGTDPNETTDPQSATLPAIFEGLLDDSHETPVNPAVVAALRRLFDMKDTQKLYADLNQAYPEPRGLRFLNPEPLYDVESHLKANKSFFALKADALLVKLAEHNALLARPLADAMSYLAESRAPLDAKVLAERLSDLAKTLILSSKLNESARVELACYAFKVPISAAKTERGVSLLGPSFAKNVDRLRKDKKVLLGDDASTSAPRFRPYARQGPDRAPPRRLSWRQNLRSPDWQYSTRQPPQGIAHVHELRCRLPLRVGMLVMRAYFVRQRNRTGEPEIPFGRQLMFLNAIGLQER